MTFTKVSEMWTSLSVFMQAISASHQAHLHISADVLYEWSQISITVEDFCLNPDGAREPEI